MTKKKTPGVTSERKPDPSTCSFPGCNRRLYAKGLCQTHHRQRSRTGELKPIRLYRKRIPGTVKLAGQRVSRECAGKVVREAQRRGITVGGLVSEIVEAWVAGKRRSPRQRK